VRPAQSDEEQSMPEPSRRLDRFPPYPLADVPRIKRELRARGVDVIDLGAGDADLPPPPAAVQALCQAAAEPDMGRYAFQLGLPALREAIASWMQRRFAVPLDPYAEVLPLVGSKEGLAHLALGFLDPGDVAICPDPGYAPYVGGAVLAGAEAYTVRLDQEHGFLLPFEEIPDAVAARAKLLFLNYPNNPTAATAPNDYLERAIAFCRRHDILLAFDNAYSEIAFDGYRPPSILELRGARDVAVEFHSFSKTYNMTGWRIGWVAGRSDVLEVLSKVKSLVDTGQFLAVQAAARAALGVWETWVPENVAEFQRRRDAMVRALCAKGFSVTAPRATMYVWPPVPPGVDAARLARRALVEQGLVVLPGTALGAGGAGFLRIALTQPVPRLEEAADRLSQVLT
jgi:LL-diaminopimelate aminotransferase